MELENITLSEITQSPKNRHNTYAVPDSGMLTPEARTAPETTNRLYEVQKQTKAKKKKEKTIMFNLYTPRKLWLFPGYILFYMYFMLIVTSKILMHTI